MSGIHHTTESSRFGFVHGPPIEESFEAQSDSVFQLVDPGAFNEPPPGFEKFKKKTKSTKNIQIAKITGNTKVGKTQTARREGKQTEETQMVEYYMVRKGKTTLSIEGSTGERIYQFEPFQARQYAKEKSKLSVSSGDMAQVSQGQMNKMKQAVS